MRSEAFREITESQKVYLLIVHVHACTCICVWLVISLNTLHGAAIIAHIL